MPAHCRTRRKRGQHVLRFLCFCGPYRLGPLQIDPVLVGRLIAQADADKYIFGDGVLHVSRSNLPRPPKSAHDAAAIAQEREAQLKASSQLAIMRYYKVKEMRETIKVLLSAIKSDDVANKPQAVVSALAGTKEERELDHQFKSSSNFTRLQTISTL